MRAAVWERGGVRGARLHGACAVHHALPLQVAPMLQDGRVCAGAFICMCVCVCVCVCIGTFLERNTPVSVYTICRLLALLRTRRRTHAQAKANNAHTRTRSGAMTHTDALMHTRVPTHAHTGSTRGPNLLRTSPSRMWPSRTGRGPPRGSSLPPTPRLPLPGQSCRTQSTRGNHRRRSVCVCGCVCLSTVHVHACVRVRVPLSS